MAFPVNRETDDENRMLVEARVEVPERCLLTPVNPADLGVSSPYDDIIYHQIKFKKASKASPAFIAISLFEAEPKRAAVRHTPREVRTPMMEPDSTPSPTRRTQHRHRDDNDGDGSPMSQDGDGDGTAVPDSAASDGGLLNALFHGRR